MGVDQAGLEDLMLPSPSPNPNPTALLKNLCKTPLVPLIQTNREEILNHSTRTNR